MALAARGPFQNVPIIFLKRLKSQSFVLRIIRVLFPRATNSKSSIPPLFYLFLYVIPFYLRTHYIYIFYHSLILLYIWNVQKRPSVHSVRIASMTTERKGIDGYPRDVRIRRNPSSRVHSYTRRLACVARRTSLFLYIKARSGREGRGESPDGCRRWYPHPGENPSARNGGWLGAVVTLSSTGDAACGLHKQRLRHTHARARTRRGSVGGWGWMSRRPLPHLPTTGNTS